jgi:hypothetical protein
MAQRIRERQRWTATLSLAKTEGGAAERDAGQRVTSSGSVAPVGDGIDAFDPMPYCSNVLLPQCPDAPMRRCTMHQYIDAPIHQSTTAPLHRCTNAPMHRCTKAQGPSPKPQVPRARARSRPRAARAHGRSLLMKPRTPPRSPRCKSFVEHTVIRGETHGEVDPSFGKETGVVVVDHEA